MKFDNPDRSAAGSRVLRTEIDVANSLFCSFNTPRSLAVYLLLKYGEFDQVLDLDINPLHYLQEDVIKFQYDYQATSIFSKNPRLPVKRNTLVEATRKWVQAERLCRSTNARLKTINEGAAPLPDDQFPVIERARAFISQVLGRLDDEKARRIVLSGRFGPGRTTRLKGSAATRSWKYDSRTYDCTPDLLTYFVDWPHMWKYADREVHVRSSNLVSFVEKNAKTKRAIAFEPCLNIYAQLGLGAYVRRRLRLFGLDLDRNDRNVELARIGSLTGAYATIDLRSASDTVSIETVRMLLPPDWFEFFCELRCTTSFIRGREVRLAKFSSMGNGFTFELESLIFTSIVVAHQKESPAKGTLAVFGDDIAMRSEHSIMAVSTLKFLGFETNEDKTFLEGVFRESCGNDFFNGHLVRPFFLRKSLRDATEDEVFYVAGNGLSRVSGSLFGGCARDLAYLPGWLRCFTAVGPRHRHQIPLGFGDDIGFHICRDDPNLRASPQSFRYAARPNRRTARSEHGALVAALATTTPPDPDLFDDLRQRSWRTAPRRGHVFTWPHIGPWL